jgi:subtilisin family serine protease
MDFAEHNGKVSGPARRQPAPDGGTAEAPYVSDQLMAQFKAGVSQKRIAAILARHHLTVRRYIDGIRVYVLGTSPDGAAAAVATLNRLPEIEYAELDYIVHGELVPNDPVYNDPYYVYAPQLIGAETAWDTTTGSPSVVVAVVDSGVSLNHPELVGHTVSCGTDICDFVNNDSDPSDDQGHGTHVAGIITAAMNNNLGATGIAPGVKVMPVKVLSAANTGSWSTIAAGITYAVSHGAKIINLSLGGTTSAQTLYNAIMNAAAQGALVVAAAGNNGDSTPFYPAAYDQTMAVSMTDDHDVLYPLSNFGPTIDIAAPGFAIYNTYWTSANPDTYTCMTGTSMAAPHVSALAALLLSVRPDLTAANLRTIIQNTAVDLGTPGRDDYFGWGRINAAAAVAAALTYTPPTATPTATATVTNTPTPPRRRARRPRRARIRRRPPARRRPRSR